MTARNKNDLRSLIEEARELISQINRRHNGDVDKFIETDIRLRDALSLLPEWQEFDPEREQTWPKPKEMPEWFLVYRSDCGVSWDTWGYEGWESDENGLTQAFQPLPPPYVKPEVKP